MAGLYTHVVEGTQYYKLPVEAWRRLLDDPAEVLRLCKDIMTADCASRKELNDVYGWYYTGANATQAQRTFDAHKQQGAEFVERLGTAGNKGSVCFTITRKMFWQLNDEVVAKTVKERDLLLLLWWMALHTIDGKRKGAKAIHNTTNADVWRRVAGFSNWADCKAFRWNGDEVILKYMAKPARYAARLRDDLMQKYDTFHAYATKGRRGWCFMFADIPRQRAFDMMAAHMANRRSPKQQFKADLADMKARARAKAEGVEVIEAEVVEAPQQAAGCMLERLLDSS